ncbi:TetR/AcrR family transcriptional regulator [Streptomyces sp. XD-27]|uniref:TetR/AcrR family transcriptional regulator n=1 Tax=Streptomyces sp. XD-27 TaxID=3062779 RepID=UPI0026F47843|nr:TetR/AcrR family transcriptional regulator [Streptomyces sp. XD-27]WKX70411.1 TetR/AcrR family transcriptional regulator [Streptomyces sp. XD-27]
MSVTTDEDTAATTARPRRRQARGERRIQQLLGAAAEVFCRSGYTAASTNAIAREAGVSPGTLYQYFPNKEAIAIELGERLFHQMRETHGQVLTVEKAALPLDEMLDAALDPMIAFNCQNPAFLALIHSSDVPGKFVEEHDALHASLLTRVEELLAAYHPDLDADQRTRTATMTFALFKAGLELVLSHEGAERQAYITELKASLYRYLAPVIGTEGRALPSRNTP